VVRYSASQSIFEAYGIASGLHQYQYMKWAPRMFEYILLATFLPQTWLKSLQPLKGQQFLFISPKKLDLGRFASKMKATSSSG
jgi:hypothetical protein